MLYHNQIFKEINIGDKVTAFIKKIRDDHKIDLTLQEEGYAKIDDFSDTLYLYLKENKQTHLNDKSSPEEIKAEFGVSKKVFKKAIGKLYKEKKIILKDKMVIFNN